jgi:hypothetical protein
MQVHVLTSFNNAFTTTLIIQHMPLSLMTKEGHRWKQPGLLVTGTSPQLFKPIQVFEQFFFNINPLKN